MPLDLQLQIPEHSSLSCRHGDPVCPVPGYEADDFLATVA